MFKIEKTEYTNKTFRLPKELLAHLETVAQREGISVNALVLQCCKYAMDNMDNSENSENN